MEYLFGPDMDMSRGSWKRMEGEKAKSEKRVQEMIGRLRVTFYISLIAALLSLIAYFLLPGEIQLVFVILVAIFGIVAILFGAIYLKLRKMSNNMGPEKNEFLRNINERFGGKGMVEYVSYVEMKHPFHEYVESVRKILEELGYSFEKFETKMNITPALSNQDLVALHDGIQPFYVSLFTLRMGHRDLLVVGINVERGSENLYRDLIEKLKCRITEEFTRE